MLYAKWSKGHVCGLSLVDFDPFCHFSVFRSPRFVAIIVIDGSKKGTA